MAESRATDHDLAPLAVIIPILSEAPGLAQLLDKAVTDLSASGHPCEVCIVTVDHLVAELPVVADSSVRSISLERGSSWGEAILAASAETRHELICTIDVPSLYAAAELPRLVRALTENDAAMVVGARIGIQEPIPARRRIRSFIVDMLAADAMGRPLPDVNSGFRVMRRQALTELADQPSGAAALPAAVTLQLLAAKAAILFVPLDAERGNSAPHHGRARETFQLIRLILAFGLDHEPRRTALLIGRMALMMLMMAAMMLMMMWMMGMLPGR